MIIEFLVAIVLIFVFCLMINYFYYKFLLEGFSRELYESKINIENFIASKPNLLDDAKDLAKMNIQTLHSFLVMLIAVVALIYSLYNLLKPVNPLNTTISELPFNVSSILIIFSLLIGIGIIIFIINYRWYKIYIKLVNVKFYQPEKYKAKADDVMQATYTEIFKLDILNFRFSISRKAQRRQRNPDASL